MSSEASFIFQGTVLDVGRANVSMVEPDERTAVVRVDRVLRAPEQMEQLTGREITVRLRKAAEPGMTAVFETQGWLYGESLAVIETGRKAPRAELPTTGEPEEVTESEASSDRAERFRSALKTRADEASAVVVGQVIGIRVATMGEPPRLSEHDPRWAVATVEVDKAVKGQQSGTVEVLFPSSEDVMWRDAPKLAVGQKSVMLLHKGAPEVEDKNASAVLHELDVQPADSADLVAKLL